MSQDLFAVVLAAVLVAAFLAVWGYVFASTLYQPAVRAVITLGAYSPAGHWRWIRQTRHRRPRRPLVTAWRTVAGWHVAIRDGVVRLVIGPVPPPPRLGPSYTMGWLDEPAWPVAETPVDTLDADAEAARRRRYARLTAGDDGAVPLELDLETEAELVRVESDLRAAAEREFEAAFGPGLDLASFNVDPGAAAERLSRNLAAGRVYHAAPMSELEREFRAACEPRGPLQFEVDGKTGESADMAVGYGDPAALVDELWGSVAQAQERAAAVALEIAIAGEAILELPPEDGRCYCSDCTAADWEVDEAVYDDDEPSPEELAAPVAHREADENWSPLAEVGRDEKPVTLKHTEPDREQRDILAEFDALCRAAREVPPWLVQMGVDADAGLEGAGLNAQAHKRWRQQVFDVPTGEWRLAIQTDAA